MAHEQLKEDVLRANLALVEAGLVVLTWGNASAVDRDAGVMAIKPSGVAYRELRAADIVLVSIETGEVIESTRRPSSDTPTHLHLYRSWNDVGAIVHTHSLHATSFAQANRAIPCLGTTHADNFCGDIPVTDPMPAATIETDYELNTGRAIVECFASRGLDPKKMPGVIVSSHGLFAWGPTSDKAVENAIVMEFAAHMAINSLALNPTLPPLSQALLHKHFYRKHGPGAYYGQGKST